MKRIEYIKSFQIEQPTGELAFDEKTNAPIIFNNVDFLRGRTLDKAFIDGVEGADAAELIFDTRRSIRTQEKLAESRGYWEFEDEHAKRLQNATVKGDYNQTIAFNAVPFMRAVRSMTSP